MDVKTLSVILGHSDVKITLNRYVHPTMDSRRKQIGRLPDFYGQIRGQQPEKRGAYRTLERFSQNKSICEKGVSCPDVPEISRRTAGPARHCRTGPG